MHTLSVGRVELRQRILCRSVIPVTGLGEYSIIDTLIHHWNIIHYASVLLRHPMTFLGGLVSTREIVMNV